jgi:hypothetical protein
MILVIHITESARIDGAEAHRLLGDTHAEACKTGVIS